MPHCARRSTQPAARSSAAVCASETSSCSPDPLPGRVSPYTSDGYLSPPPDAYFPNLGKAVSNLLDASSFLARGRLRAKLKLPWMAPWEGASTLKVRVLLPRGRYPGFGVPVYAGSTRRRDQEGATGRLSFGHRNVVDQITAIAHGRLRRPIGAARRFAPPVTAPKAAGGGRSQGDPSPAVGEAKLAGAVPGPLAIAACSVRVPRIRTRSRRHWLERYSDSSSIAGELSHTQ